MFNELPKTVDPIAFSVLVEKKVAERVPDKNTEILDILRKDSNTNLKTILEKYTYAQDAKIGLQDLETYLEAHVWDKDGQFVNTIGISTDQDDATTECVSKETYDSLKPLCIDITTVRAEIETQLEGKII
ncbi:MAG: hypothetical protein RBT33_02430 [Candidatus Dojkabacteria bacterium]|jgi:hypothetical protein|nr:hypothetical protein [Candidatus Dojkabacteria bacterium]